MPLARVWKKQEGIQCSIQAPHSHANTLWRETQQVLGMGLHKNVVNDIMISVVVYRHQFNILPQ